MVLEGKPWKRAFVSMKLLLVSLHTLLLFHLLADAEYFVIRENRSQNGKELQRKK